MFNYLECRGSVVQRCPFRPPPDSTPYSIANRLFMRLPDVTPIMPFPTRPMHVAAVWISVARCASMQPSTTRVQTRSTQMSYPCQCRNGVTVTRRNNYGTTRWYDKCHTSQATFSIGFLMKSGWSDLDLRITRARFLFVYRQSLSIDTIYF